MRRRRGRVATILSMQNGIGETALHEAIRAADMRAVDTLLTASPCLARVPHQDGASPLRHCTGAPLEGPSAVALRTGGTKCAARRGSS
jgi:hypothetical protein